MNTPVTPWNVAKLSITAFLLGAYVGFNVTVNIYTDRVNTESTRFKFSVACADSPGSVALRVSYCKDVAISSPDEKPQVCIDQMLANQRRDCEQIFDKVEADLLKKAAR